jgi:hypothetical protein
MPEETKSGGSDQNQMAMIAHLLGIVIGFVGPLIIYLTAKDKPFAYEQSKEALNFQITVVIAWIASAVLSVIGIGLLLYPLVWVANVVFCIIAGMAANKGEKYRYPFAIRLIN